VKGSLLRRCAAESAGTALLVGLGTGAIVVNARTGLLPLPWLAVAWGAAVLLPILLFVRVSGAHLNPVVSLALAASGRIDRREVPAYVLAQVAGAFLASGMVLLALGKAGELGVTVPADGQVVRAFFAEVAFTALLVASVFALADRGEGRFRWRLGLPPFAVGLSTYVIGPWSGSSLNPARTLAPAVVAGAYTDLWVYFVAVPLGALIVGALWKPRSVDRLDRGPGRTDSIA
jgi:MIP family channel proteins